MSCLYPVFPLYLQNDIAIIQVETEFVFDSSVSKVELWLSQFGVNGSEETKEFYTMVKASGRLSFIILSLIIFQK